jgi:hypothetical protein
MRTQGTHPTQDDHTSLEGSSSETLEIEVAAEDFYETTDADPDFVASMHAFPLSGKGTKEMTTGPSWLASGETMPRAMAPVGPVMTKYHFQHSGKSRIHPAVLLDEKECLATWVTVGDLAAWTLWDSGSTTTGITPTFAELAKIKVDTLEDPHMLQLGTVGSRSIIKYGVDAAIAVANVRDTAYVDIANFEHFDMIIGTPWMRKHNVLLDFTANCVVVNGCPIPAIKMANKDLDPRSRQHHIMDKHKTE